jgi:hypothetical protein
MAKKKGAVAVVEPDDEELELEEDEDLELEEDDEDEEEAAPAPKAKKGATRKAPATTKGTDGYGITWLADHINDTTGKSTSPAAVRVLLRKMAADGTLSREVGTDKSRYSFTGENDRTVKAIIKQVKSGALDKKPRTGNADNLAAARAAKAAKAAGTPAATKTKKAKAAEVEEAAPAKATRKRRG